MLEMRSGIMSLFGLVENQMAQNQDLLEYYYASTEPVKEELAEIYQNFSTHLHESEESDIFALLSLCEKHNFAYSSFYSVVDQKNLITHLIWLENIYYRKHLNIKIPETKVSFDPMEAFKFIRSGRHHDFLNYISSTKEAWKAELFRGAFLCDDGYRAFCDSRAVYPSPAENKLFKALAGDLKSLNDLAGDSFYDRLWAVLFSAFCTCKKNKELIYNFASLHPKNDLELFVLNHFSNTNKININPETKYVPFFYHYFYYSKDRSDLTNKLLYKFVCQLVENQYYDAAVCYAKRLEEQPNIIDCLAKAGSFIMPASTDYLYACGEYEDLPERLVHVILESKWPKDEFDDRMLNAPSWLLSSQSPELYNQYVHKVLYLLAKENEFDAARKAFLMFDTNYKMDEDESRFWDLFFISYESHTKEHIKELFRFILLWTETANTKQKKMLEYMITSIARMYESIIKLSF